MKINIEELYSRLLEKITKEFNLAREQGTLDLFAEKFGLLEEDESYGYVDRYNSKILVLGNSRFPLNVMYAIAKDYGLDRDMLEYVDYEETVHFDYSKLRGYSNYSDVIVGAIPHSAKGIDGYSSFLAMVESNPEEFPKVQRAMAGEQLKLTKTSFRNCLEKTRLYNCLCN